MENENNESLEENLDMVNYIMLHRIYDVITLIAKNIVGEEEISKMVKYHEDGFLLGPSPSYRKE